METVAIYARISQDRSGLQAGVERQVEDCRALAERKGLRVYGDPYIDNDVSASTARRREGWSEVLDLIRAGTINGIVVWHTDRLYRKVRDLAVLLDIAEQYKVTIHAVTAGDIDLSSPTGRMLATMVAGAAAFEVEQKAARSARKNLDTAKRGGFHGGPVPLGYRLGATTGTIEVDPRQATVLREAATRLLSDEALNSVTRWARVELDRPGLKPNSLKAALTRPTIVGLRQHFSVEDRKEWNRRRAAGEVSGEVPEDAATYSAEWEPILFMDEWEALKAKFSTVRRGRKPTKSLLSGVLICEVCGSHLGYSTDSYKCPGPDRNGCAGVAISTSAIHDYVSKHMAQGVAPTNIQQLPVMDIQVDSSEVDALANRRSKVLALHRGGLLSDQELEDQLIQYQRQLEHLEREGAIAQRRRLQTLAAQRIDRGTWDRADTTERARLIRMAFPDGITIFKSPRGRKSGARFNPGRVHFGPPPWNDQRLPEDLRSRYLQDHEDRMNGIQPEPWPSPEPVMTEPERAAHEAEFAEARRQLDQEMGWS